MTIATSGMCFVIQPFDDGGAFDRRYAEVVQPAIETAQLAPRRIDQVAGVVKPVDSIEAEIRAADICLADITTDNPNVWYEIGFAFAADKDVVLIASRARFDERKLPFDIQHRRVIKYDTQSPGDFDALKTNIVRQLVALREKTRELKKVTADAPLEPSVGLELEPHELATLVVVYENGDDATGAASAFAVENDVMRAGFTKVALKLAVHRLRARGMLEVEQQRTRDDTLYVSYRVIDDGVAWLVANQHRLALRQQPRGGPVGGDEPEF